MIEFLGIKQVAYNTYAQTEVVDKIGYLWLVTNESATGTSDGSYDIYFGTRKYSGNGKTLTNLRNAFGGLLDENGEFILPIEKEFISFNDESIDSFSDILYALDSAITANQTALLERYTKEEIDNLLGNINDAIESCIKGITVKISDEESNDLIADASGNVVIDLSEYVTKSELESAGKIQDVLVDEQSVVEDGIAKISISGKADASLVEALSERIKTLENAEKISDITYDETEQVIKLVDASGNTIGEGFDASAFLVDGMLESVEKGENAGEFIFTFNVNDKNGEKKSFTVDFSEFIDVYVGSDSIEVSGNTISLKSANADLVQVSEIPVGGTPLADILTAKGINTISADNLQAVLESLFSQNLWAENPRINIPTALTTSMSSPSITFDKTGTQEVGTTINVSASAKTASASASISYSGFTYGYSLENDNTKDGDTPGSVIITGVKNAESDYKLSFVTNNGFGGEDIADVAGSSTSGNSLVVEEGTNKVTVTASSPTFSATVPAQNKIYACSSLKKTDEEHIVDASEETTISSAVKTASNNTSVTGAYKLYIGQNDTIISTSDAIKNLSTKTWTNDSNDVQIISATTNYEAGKYLTIAMPSSWSLKEAVNSFGLDGMIFGSPTTVEYILPNDTKIDYKVYTAFLGEPYGFNSITIGK